MAQETSRSKPAWDGKTCLNCGGPANIGYDGPCPSMACQACAAGLFRVLAQSGTVLVPLADHPAAPATDRTAPENSAPALPAASDETPRARRQPRPRARRVPLYDPLTLGLRRRFRRDS
jgi:hypothetical protein